MVVIKRILDITFSVFALVILSPVIVVAALLIRYKIGSPILFRQQRPGLHSKPFYLYKFRSMNDQCDEYGVLLPDEQRITSLGHILRKLSIDELPQLWNVLIGEMSIVGPRPLLMKYLPLYNSRQSRRHNVRPGITGWAQVNGRNSISWEEKFDYDIWYVENKSVRLDTKILLLTFKKVLMSEEVNQSNTIGMDDFLGTFRFSSESTMNDEEKKID